MVVFVWFAVIVLRGQRSYAASLSADAVPALTSALPSLPSDAQGIIAARLVPDWSAAKNDWRSWSLGRAEAIDAVHAQRTLLLSALRFAPPAAPGRDSNEDSD